MPIPERDRDAFAAVQQAIISVIQSDGYSFDLPDLFDYSWARGMPDMQTIPFAKWQNMAFMGDKLAGVCIADQLTKAMPNATPHLYSVHSYGLVSNKTFAHILKKASLLAVASRGPVIVEPDLVKRGGDFFEAILSLMLNQRGMEFVRSWLESVFSPLICAAAQAYLAVQSTKRMLLSNPSHLAIGSADDKASREIEALTDYLASAPARGRLPSSHYATSSRALLSADDTRYALSSLTNQNSNTKQAIASSSYTRQGHSQSQKLSYPRSASTTQEGSSASSSYTRQVLPHTQQLSYTRPTSRAREKPGAYIEVNDLCDSSPSSQSSHSRQPSFSGRSSSPSDVYSRDRSASLMSCSPSDWHSRSPPRGRSRAPSPSPPPRGRHPARYLYPVESPPRQSSFSPYPQQSRGRAPSPPALARRIRSPSLPSRHLRYPSPEKEWADSYRSRYRVPSQPRREFCTPSPPPRSRRVPLEDRIRTPSRPPRRSPSPLPSWRAYEPREQSPRHFRSYSGAQRAWMEGGYGEAAQHSASRVYY